jgi:hypothetical protein
MRTHARPSRIWVGSSAGGRAKTKRNMRLCPNKTVTGWRRGAGRGNGTRSSPHPILVPRQPCRISRRGRALRRQPVLARVSCPHWPTHHRPFRVWVGRSAGGPMPKIDFGKVRRSGITTGGHGLARGVRLGGNGGHSSVALTVRQNAVSVAPRRRRGAHQY